MKGEVDFVEDITPLQVRALDGQQGITAHNGRSRRASTRSAFNTGSVDTKTDKPIGDPNPAVLDPKFRHRPRLRRRPGRLIRSAYQGGGSPGVHDHPAGLLEVPVAADRPDAFSFDLKKAGELLDAAGYKKGSDGKRTMPDGSPIGTLRLFARVESPKSSIDTMNFFKEWLGDLGIDSKVTAMDSSKLGDVILDGDYDVFQWDWYVEPDPDWILADFTCAQRGGCPTPGTATGVRRDVRRSRTPRPTSHAGGRSSKKMRRSSTRTRPTSSPPTRGSARPIRSDRFACFEPQPDPGGVWLVQYGGQLTRHPAAPGHGRASAAAPAPRAPAAARRAPPPTRQRAGRDRRLPAALRRRRGARSAGAATGRPRRRTVNDASARARAGRGARRPLRSDGRPTRSVSGT